MANQQVSANLLPSGTPLPLTSSGNVATMIRSVDALHGEISLPLWKFNASFEKTIFNRTLLNQK